MKLTLIVLTFLLAVHCDYKDGEITVGLLPLVKKATNKYSVYEWVYGVQWTNAYIDSVTQRIYFQADYTKCPGGAQCGARQYAFFSAELSNLTIASYDPDPIDNQQPQAYYKSDYNPLITDRFGYFIGGGQSNIFSLHVLKKNSPEYATLLTQNNVYYHSATAIKSDDQGHAWIYAAYSNTLQKTECNADTVCTLTKRFKIQNFTALSMLSDTTDNVFFVANNIDGPRNSWIVPVDKQNATYDSSDAFQISDHPMANQTESTLVAQFINSNMELFVVWELRTHFDISDFSQRQGGIYKYKITKLPNGKFSYNYIGGQEMTYQGQITAFTQDGTVAYFTTTGAGVIRVYLDDRITSANAWKAIVVRYTNVDSSGTLMKLTVAAMTPDRKTLFVMGDWWGTFAVIDLTKFDEPETTPAPTGTTTTVVPQPTIPEPPKDMKVLWIVLGVVIPVASLSFILAICGIVICVAVRYKRRQMAYTNL